MKSWLDILEKDSVRQPDDLLEQLAESWPQVSRLVLVAVRILVLALLLHKIRRTNDKHARADSNMKF